MICPLKFSVPLRDFMDNWLGKTEWDCENAYCQAWEAKAKYNPITKQYEGDCRLFMLDRKISGGINIHPY